MAKVSIIVPIYNVEKYLDRCVQSLLCQTLRDIEIILVDDQSPDRCPQMCDGYMKRDSRIKVVHKKNAGLGLARNSGMEVASGEYIAFVDSDDYVDLDMFESMYTVAKNQDADFVRVDNYKERVDGTITNQEYIPPMREGLYEKDELREKLLYPQLGMLPEDNGSKYVSCSVWRNIYRKAIIDEHSITFVSERELISEDIPFNLEFMMYAKRAVVINRKFYHYIVNDKSLTQTYRPDRFEREIILYNDLIRRTKEKGIYDECRVRLERHLLARARMCVRNELLGNKNKRLANENVISMLSCEELKTIFAAYPVWSMPMKYKFVFFLMKYKCSTLLSVVKQKL